MKTELENLKQDTIYNKAYKNKRAVPAITTDIECEILIIGGGLAGLSLAYELDRNDASFVLIESNRIGDAASGANGGFCSPGWAVCHEKLKNQFGSKVAKTFHSLSLEGTSWMKSFEAIEGFENIDLKMGTLSLYLLEKEKIVKDTFYKRDNFLNDGCQFVPQEKLGSYINSSKYNCGILSKNGFHFNPFEFLNALKTQLEKKPERIFENSKMVGFHETGDGCKVQLQNGLSIYAKKLILTTGGYGGQETGFLRSR